MAFFAPLEEHDLVHVGVSALGTDHALFEPHLEALPMEIVAALGDRIAVVFEADGAIIDFGAIAQLGDELWASLLHRWLSPSASAAFFAVLANQADQDAEHKKAPNDASDDFSGDCALACRLGGAAFVAIEGQPLAALLAGADETVPTVSVISTARGLLLFATGAPLCAGGSAQDEDHRKDKQNFHDWLLYRA